jgi:hypothetical protein
MNFKTVLWGYAIAFIAQGLTIAAKMIIPNQYSEVVS